MYLVMLDSFLCRNLWMSLVAMVTNLRRKSHDVKLFQTWKLKCITCLPLD